MGPQGPAARIMAALQQPPSTRREYPRVSALELDRVGYLALYPCRKHSGCASLLREGTGRSSARRLIPVAAKRSAAAARRTHTACEMPHAVTGLRALHGSHPF